MNKVIAVLVLTSVTVSTFAQKSGKDEGFKTLTSGLSYKLLYDAPGSKNPKPGDFMELTIVTQVSGTSIGDSTIYSTNDLNNGKPVEYQAQSPSFKGDLIEGIFLMTPGDSAIFKISVDSLVTSAQAPPAPWMKINAGQMLIHKTKLVSVRSAEERDEEQKKIDEKILTEYFNKKNIKVTKTTSGLYYKVEKQGNGSSAKVGDTVVVNYTGMSMEGKKFDSNTDEQFGHVEPFQFPVGVGAVIKGWDESFQIFKKGTKATLYIPSYLAYGKSNSNPSLPENGILVFEIELMDIKPAAGQ